MTVQLEYYMEKFRITQWRDGCVYTTESLGYDWFHESVVKGNRPAETNVVYAAASTEVAQNHATIRRAKTQ